MVVGAQVDVREAFEVVQLGEPVVVTVGLVLHCIRAKLPELCLEVVSSLVGN